MDCVPRYREHLYAAVTIDVMNGHFMKTWHPYRPEKETAHLGDIVQTTQLYDLLFFKIKIWWIKLDWTAEDGDCSLVILVTEGLIF